MKIYNTLSRQAEEFEPIEEGKLYFYVCGLTPYDHAHLGHARTYISMDMVKRYFLHKNYEVLHIQNITDVEDKIFNRSRETGKTPQELAEKFHGEALEEFDRLNILRADHYPKVSEHIPEIIGMIEKLVEKGHAYETATGVYFSVSSFPDYGKLSGQKPEGHRSGARCGIEETKKDPADFALWKKGEDVLTFDSPWGKGRPGWHIECSAMSMKYTGGRELDIHGGGRDLAFPHHENEIAQAEGALGHRFARYWMHTGFLTVKGEKMSKSLGNFIVLKDLLEKYPPYALRLFFLHSHYRSPVDYSQENISSSQTTAERMFNFLEHTGELPESGGTENGKLRKRLQGETDGFYNAMDNDFDTPTALSHMFGIMTECFSEMRKGEPDYPAIAEAKKDFEKMMWILGLEKEEKKLSPEKEKEIESLVQKREAARKEKNFKLADEIRDELARMGILLEDTEEGPKWKMR